MTYIWTTFLMVGQFGATWRSVWNLILKPKHLMLNSIVREVAAGFGNLKFRQVETLANNTLTLF